MTDKNLKKISANIIADSLNEYGQRLTTFVLVFPRIVLAEFNTHRILSRNSASSRAIPFEKMVKMVEEDPFIPIKWMKDHKGMQGTEYFHPNMEEGILSRTWLDARDNAVESAKELSKIGLTKQIVNRLLEPFMWHTVIVTGTEWENFFALRAHDQAEIHIQELAYRMLDEYNASTPKKLKAGEWHIPFGDRINLPPTIPIPEGLNLDEGVQLRKVMIATARCARVSYLNFEGKDDYNADIRLHDILLSSGHMSPFEHCACAMSKDEYDKSISGQVKVYNDYGGTFTSGLVVEIDPEAKGWSGNFRGFIQYRKMIPNENKTDRRVTPK